jgi:hypothetical protein
MKQVVPGLYASPPQPLPIAPSMDQRAFLCVREKGNVLIYSADPLDGEAAAIDDLGGVSRRYLSHRHESDFAAGPADRPLYVHALERAAVERRHSVDGTYTDRHRVDDDFEVIPIPGHTPGATAYLWENGEHRVLFSGDTVYLGSDGWAVAVLDENAVDDYVASLELLRDLDFDVLVPWIANRSGPFFVTTSGQDSRRRIDAILDRIADGARR